MASVLQTSQISRALAAAESECVLATLVRAAGSSYRRPGALMLVLPNRRVVGGITAGCLEEDIRQCAFEWTRAGACVRVFNTGSAADDALGWGSGCKGALHVLLQRVPPEYSAFQKLTQVFIRRESAACATVFETDPRLNLPLGTRFLFSENVVHADIEAAELKRALLLEARNLQRTMPLVVRYKTADGDFSLFWEPIQPAIQLCVFGAGESVGALLDCGRNLSWETVLCNGRTELYNRQCGLNANRILEVFPGDLPAEFKSDRRTAAVVMTHRFDDDLAIVRALMQTDIQYVGVLGGRVRNRRLRFDLAETLSPHDLKKLLAPVGLDLGATEPAEIALAISGEVLAFMNGRAAGHLGSRTESINAPVQNEERFLNIPCGLEPAACR